MSDVAKNEGRAGRSASRFDSVPPELRSTPQWIAWRLTERNGKPDKPPIDYRTGMPGDVRDPATWMPFTLAVQHAHRFDGIGFAFTPKDEFAGVDLDHCIDEEGELEPWAERIVDGLQSYTELSPSATGLHIYVRGRLPVDSRRKIGGFGPDGKGAVEMYDRARYFTVTGRHWPGTPANVHDRGEELLAYHREIFGDQINSGPLRIYPDGSNTPFAVPESADFNTLTSDEEILARARTAANGQRFAALFDEGDLTAYHGDWSRGDLALCSHLAFWCRGDAERIDRLFRRSSLFRPKWDEARGNQTYGQRTLNRALAGMKAFYDPSARSDLPPAGGVHANGDDAPPNRTDLGNARRLAMTFGGDLRYCHPWKSWLAWSGDRWKPDETALVYRYARSIVRQLHDEAVAEGDDKFRKILVQWALACEAEKKINAMVSLARQEQDIPILPGDLDAWPWLLNCPNGTVNLRTGKLGPHLRDDHLTKCAAVAFDPNASCPNWDAFLYRVMGGDLELAEYVRRAVGYSLTGDVSEHVLFFLYGRGRNGKSTFLNSIQHALGDYAITVNADLLTSKNGDDHPTGVADLQGRRFVTTIEVEDGRRMAESLVKSLTGGDRIRARRMRQDFFEFDPTHTIFLAANHKPTVRGTDEGIWRRIKMIPFKVQIAASEVDKNLPSKLRDEAPGILAWAIRGCLEWQEVGLSEPSVVTEATSEYRAEMDLIADFLDDRCTLNPQARVRASDLYHAYSSWCKDTGNFAHSMNKFGRMLTERGFEAEKSNSASWRIGLALVEAEAAVPAF